MTQSGFDETLHLILEGVTAGRQFADIAHEHGVSQAVISYCWSHYGGMALTEVKRLRSFENQNALLFWVMAKSMNSPRAFEEVFGRPN